MIRTIPDSLKPVVGFNVPMSKYTTLGVGGPARMLAKAETVAQLQDLLAYCHGEGLSVLLIGAGSNALFCDSGYDGCVVKLGSGFQTIEPSDAGSDGRIIVTAGGAVKLGRLLRYGFENQLLGLQMTAGIPGTVGGAVAMNAGSQLGEIKDSFVDCEILHPDGRHEIRERAQMEFSYRHSSIKPGEIVVCARFETRKGDVSEVQQRVEEFMTYRKTTQPLQFPNCGSVFTNPPGDAAGRLIDACGLKGTKIGGAEISSIHANWILNRGGATSADIAGLIDLARNRVLETFGIELHTEIRYLGDWPEPKTNEDPAAEEGTGGV